jgi:hypothetical protein
MTYHPRIETSEMGSFLTTRSRNSELWFSNNAPLELAVLGYAAKYSLRYDVKLYGLAIEGNHIHGPADFPNCNRADFMRDLNSSIARAVARCTPSYPGGRFWARRYSSEFLPAPEDIEERFFYTVLQIVQDGLVEKISEYNGYNCFHDAVWGKSRKFKIVNWGRYNAAKRGEQTISIADYTDTFILKYERIPGYEHLSQREYAELMHKKLEERRQKIVFERKLQGLGFAGKQVLKNIPCGSLPRRTKKSTTISRRPRVLSVCSFRRKDTNAWYFNIYSEYKEASLRYRSGELDVEFPPGTYRPPVHHLVVCPPT